MRILIDRGDTGGGRAGSRDRAGAPPGDEAGSPPRRVALVKLSALGDVVHALPLVASLRSAWPEAEITWVVQPGPWRLLRGRPDVDEFLLFRRARGLRAFPEFWRGVRGRRFDLVLDCHGKLKSGLVTAALRAPVKLGFDRRRAPEGSWLFTTHRLPPGPPRHVQDELFEFLDHLGVPVLRRWDLHFTDEEREARRRFFRELDRPALAVVLRSSSPVKDWSLEGYARALEAAEGNLGLRPVLVGGATPGEREAAAELAALTRARVVDAMADDPRRLAWLIAGSALALSPDTGPLHLAAALGTPVVGVYGATDPKRYGPYGRFGELVVDRYGSPGQMLPSRRRRPGRMTRITVEEVVEKLELAVRTYGAAPAR